ncbi:MAG: hypothetical protein ABF242_09130 [Flavobacteriales bacterium]
MSFSQYKRYGGKKKPQKMAPFVQALENNGWFISPGITLTPKLNFFSHDPELSLTDNGTTYEAMDLQQQSKVGAYLEVGRYRLLSTKKLISYIDYGLAYKMLRSGQTYDLRSSGLLNDTTSFTQSFSNHNISGFFNANNVLAINKNIFFQNSLGVNLDYAIVQNLDTDDTSPFAGTYQEETSRLKAQLHYKFGIGIRIGERLYAIPSIEIPLLTGWKWEGGRSTFGAFNSRYRPMIISVRFAWLTKPSCPKVWDNDPSTQNGGGL